MYCPMTFNNVCCEFLADQFSGTKGIVEDREDFNSFMSDLCLIQKEYNKLEIGDA